MTAVAVVVVCAVAVLLVGLTVGMLPPRQRRNGVLDDSVFRKGDRA